MGFRRKELYSDCLGVC